MNKDSTPQYANTAPIVKTEPASTVIPVREADGGGIEVYMTQRSYKLVFLGGYYVFPGGKVDPQDSDPEAIKRCNGITPDKAKAMLNSDLEPGKCLAHWVAGIRELFEEAGILLASYKNRKVPDFNVRRVRHRYDKFRKLLQDGEIEMNYMMKKNRLHYATDQLIYFSHWVTPPGSPIRFDTRFFVAIVPQSQRARFHLEEVKEGVWLKPADAIEKALRGEWRMIPPTMISLQTVARYNSISELVTHIAK